MDRRIQDLNQLTCRCGMASAEILNVRLLIFDLENWGEEGNAESSRGRPRKFGEGSGSKNFYSFREGLENL